MTKPRDKVRKEDKEDNDQSPRQPVEAVEQENTEPPKEQTVTDEARVATTTPSSLMDFGQTNLRPGDLVMPRVKIAQQMSQEVADKKAEAGDWFNTLTGESYGPSFRIQPILPVMQRVLLVRQEKRDRVEEVLDTKLSEGDGLKCRSYDMVHGQGEPGIECELCPLSQWTDGNTPPLCTETYNIAGSTELGDLVIISTSKSGAKTGKRMFSAIRMSRAAPWSRFFVMTTRADRNDKGNFFVPDFTIDREVPDTGQLANAIHWATQLRGVVIDVTPPEDDEAEGGVDPNDPNLPF